MIVCIAAALFGCFSKKDSSGATEIVFWTTDSEADRLAVQMEIAQRFMKQNPGITIKVIPVQESELPKKMVAAKVSNTLPDVLRIGMEYVHGYASQGIINKSAATQVIQEIGQDNFYRATLDPLRTSNGDYIAVPVDAWVQGIYYRKDWFNKHNLPPPNTWQRILDAAEKFHNPSKGVYGIIAATDPDQIYTQQVFENIALSAGARLFDRYGTIAFIDNPENRKKMSLALEYYHHLIALSPPGNNYWRQARQYYLTGRAAMIFYSNYIVDDIAGFDLKGSEIEEGLAAKTGFVPIIHHQAGDRGASYGQIVTLAVSKTADLDASKKWIMYLMGDEYMTLLNTTPGGKIPVLKSAVSQWGQHEIFQPYEEGFAETLVESLNEIQRWGFAEGNYFNTISDISGRKSFPKTISKMAQGDLTPAEALIDLENRLSHISHK